MSSGKAVIRKLQTIFHNQGTQWEKLPTNQIHLVFQIPAHLVNSYTDKQNCDNAHVSV